MDDMLKARLRRKGAVLIEGAKWCGKTTTAEQHASSVLYMADPEVARVADVSIKRLLKGERPRLLDEWQVACCPNQLSSQLKSHININQRRYGEGQYESNAMFHSIRVSRYCLGRFTSPSLTSAMPRTSRGRVDRH